MKPGRQRKGVTAMKKNEQQQNRISNLNELLMFRAWGAILVIASFLGLFVGQWIDVKFNTMPFFMIGLFILAIFLLIARLYMEFNKTNNQMGNIKRRHA
jgi:undecaprenyl pyrophosphate phosphatase UppP